MDEQIKNAEWVGCADCQEYLATITHDYPKSQDAALFAHMRARHVATCEMCGGKYRPAGGPCLHEHPHGVLSLSGPVCCLVCGVAWQPGHTCLAEDIGEPCVYCDSDRVSAPYDVPPVDDDQAWELLATEHQAWCEWIETRAHRRGVAGGMPTEADAR